MLKSISSYIPYASASSSSSSPSPADERAAPSRPEASHPGLDLSRAKVGLEDPHSEALRDDPAVFAAPPPASSGARGVKSEPEPAATSAGSSAAGEAQGGGARAEADEQPAKSAPTAPPATPSSPPSKKLLDARGKAFIDPRLYGGSCINKTSAQFGEPLNVIISAQSSPELLTRKGLQSYLRSLGLDLECLGLHSGAPTYGWLDPRGWVAENFLYREVYSPLDHVFGTCIESLVGGNHIRAYQQQGTGAWFFATSKEENVLEHHMIVPDGYNLGRDLLVEASQNKKNNGVTSFLLKKYRTQVEYVEGLMPAGAQEINHGIAVDGRVAVLTVQLLDRKSLSLATDRRRGRERQRVLERAAAAVATGDGVGPTPPRASAKPKWLKRLSGRAGAAEKAGGGGASGASELKGATGVGEAGAAKVAVTAAS